MSFAVSFIIWTFGGALIGWLARRAEQQPVEHPYPYVTLGIVGGFLDGLLWFPKFAVAQPGSTFSLFDFLAFNLFVTSFGFIVAFWAVHISRSAHEYLQPRSS